jgi:hypothetical protein
MPSDLFERNMRVGDVKSALVAFLTGHLQLAFTSVTTAEIEGYTDPDDFRSILYKASVGLKTIRRLVEKVEDVAKVKEIQARVDALESTLIRLGYFERTAGKRPQ